MDQLPDTLVNWLLQYGSITLFVLLALGIIALPIPEESLIVASGILIHLGDLCFLPTIVAAYAGSICGITISYILGSTIGSHFIAKYGSRIGLTQVKMDQVHSWFERYGKWTLFFGYFIPGVRHFTGLSSGISRLKYHDFALFAYSGALFWVSTFLSIGYFFGKTWISFFKYMEDYLDIVVSIAIVVALIFLYVKFKNNKTK